MLSSERYSTMVAVLSCPVVSNDSFFQIADGSTCFDRVLFYGNEATLTIFDVLLFSLTSTYCQDYLAAALTTFLIAKVICR